MLKNQLLIIKIPSFMIHISKLFAGHPIGWINTVGIICLVLNGGWIDGNAQDGFRKKQLEREFSSIYIFNLGGN